MSQLRLGVSRRGPDGREHVKQREYVEAPRVGHEGIVFTDLVCGRGFGKTLAAAVLLFYMCFVYMRGFDFVLTEPRHKDLKKVFMPAWRQVVPEHLWQWKIADDEIICKTGSRIHLMSRNVNNPSNPLGKVGLTVSGIVHDEAAVGFDEDTFNRFLPFVRQPGAPGLFVDTISTPMLGNGYFDYCNNPTHRLFRGSSYDNPFITKEAIDSWSQQMDPDFRRQEVMGEWMSLAGRIFKGWSDEPWPRGNIFTHPVQGQGYSLFCDIGLHSSWLIVKHPVVNGQLLDVVVGEWHPDGNGHSDEITKEIDAEYGPPTAVYIGSDVGTDSVNVRNSSAATIIANRWGDMIHVQSPTGDLMSKALQLAAIKRGIVNGKGRRICLWDKCKNHTANLTHKTRSFKRMIDEDAFPKKGDAQQLIWPKGPKYPHEHCRDALAYGTICKYPPVYGRNRYI